MAKQTKRRSTMANIHTSKHCTEELMQNKWLLPFSTLLCAKLMPSAPTVCVKNASTLEMPSVDERYARAWRDSENERVMFGYIIT